MSTAMKQNFTVRQGALDGVESFLSVAAHRSFRRAAAELRVTPSAISQAVRALEARIGAALFIRTTRSVGLTEAGERFLARAKPAFEELVAASEVARELGGRGEPAGVELVEGAELLRRQPLIFRPEGGERRLQPLGQAGRTIVVAHAIEVIGHGKVPLLQTAVALDVRPLPASDYPR